MRPDLRAVLTVITRWLTSKCHSSFLRTYVALVCLTMCVACEGSPTAPTAYTSFSGVWQIEYRTTSCTGWRHCVFRVGKTQKMLLTVSQTGRDVAGVFAFGSGGGVSVDVTGRVNEAGEMTLAGVARPRGSEFDYPVDYEVTLTEFQARQIRQGGMTGAFAYTERGEGQGDFAGSARTTAEIIGAVREL